MHQHEAPLVSCKPLLGGSLAYLDPLWQPTFANLLQGYAAMLVRGDEHGCEATPIAAPTRRLCHPDIPALGRMALSCVAPGYDRHSERALESEHDRVWRLV